MGDLIGYARVSTTEQHPALQLDALESAGCVRVFTDRASGTVADRPELARALDHLRAGEVGCSSCTLVAYATTMPSRGAPQGKEGDMSGYPRARSESLITEETGDELLVYDEATHTAHALSAEACSVWRCCDGHSSVNDISRRSGLEQARVSQALEGLSRAGLIEEPKGISRRALYKRTAKFGAAALSAPLIYSVAIRPASAAASTLCGPGLGASCAWRWDNSTCTGAPFDTSACTGINPGCTCQNVNGPCVPFGAVWAKTGTCMPS